MSLIAFVGVFCHFSGKMEALHGFESAGKVFGGITTLTPVFAKWNDTAFEEISYSNKSCNKKIISDLCQNAHNSEIA